MTTCAKCAEEIDPDAVRCPHCDYAPAEEYREKSSQHFKVAGMSALLFWTIIMIPCIPAFLISGWWFRRKAKAATPTAN